MDHLSHSHQKVEVGDNPILGGIFVTGIIPPAVCEAREVPTPFFFVPGERTNQHILFFQRLGEVFALDNCAFQ